MLNSFLVGCGSSLLSKVRDLLFVCIYLSAMSCDSLISCVFVRHGAVMVSPGFIEGHGNTSSLPKMLLELGDLSSPASDLLASLSEEVFLLQCSVSLHGFSPDCLSLPDVSTDALDGVLSSFPLLFKFLFSSLNFILGMRHDCLGSNE